MIARARTPVTLALMAFGWAAPLRSQVPDTIAPYPLEGVTVTTQRGAFDRSLVTQRIDVVPDSTIELSGAVDIAGALRATTPVDVIAYPGLLSGVSVRGFRPQISNVNPRTLVLIDGRPAGTNNLSLIHAGGIERIEVQRGPGSSLYGSSAMGGIVNVITRRSTGEFTGRVKTRFGSFETYGVELDAGGRVMPRFDVDLALTASGQGTGYRTGSRRTFGSDELRKVAEDGTTAMLPRVPSDTFVAFTRHHARSGKARVGYEFGERWRADLRAEAFESDGVENPGDLNPQDWDSRSLKDVYRHSVDFAVTGEGERHSPLLRIYATRESNDYFSTPEPPHFINFRQPTRTVGGQLQDGIRVGEHTLTVGADIARTTVESEAFSDAGVPAAPYNPDSAIGSVAGFVQGHFRLLDARLTLTGGARLDRIDFEVLETPNLAGYLPNRESHLSLSPNLGARLGLVPGLQLYGNVGRAFVTPEAFSVAGYVEQSAGPEREAVFVTRGNPDLRPETSWTWDAGLALLAGGMLEADIGYFQTDVRDRITSEQLSGAESGLTADGDTILSVTSYRNVDRARIRGIEGRLSLDLGSLAGVADRLRLFTTGTRILRAEEISGGSASTERILNVADLTLVSGVRYDDHRLLRGSFSARYVGERVDTDYLAWWAPGRITYPAYLVLDLVGAVRLAERYTVGLEILNLGDEDYFEIRGYNQPGRSLRATVGIDF